MHLFKYRWTASVCAILGAAVLALTPAAAAYGAPLPRTAEAYGVMLRRPVWPYDTGVLSESGIVLDLDSGAVLYGQRIHMQEAPASITKLLTALVVLENAALDEQVVFSHDAVYNVEGGSGNKYSLDEGDVLSVEDCLYLLLLASSNQSANALAEHVAGSRDGFVDMMNRKVKELGCEDSHFANPSGLNDPNHYTTPYDYALIAQAAFSNPTFVEFDSTTYYELPPNATNAGRFTVYCGHKMLKKNSNQYYPGIIGGKTGYTTLAGNTLVTCAERDGLRLITVVLNGHSTHYSDTKAMLDFGFANFRNENISDYDATYTSLENDTNLTGSNPAVLHIDTGRTATLPKNAQFSDAQTELSYDLDENDPKNAVARIRYLYDGRVIGTTWLRPDSDVRIDRSATPSEGGDSQDPHAKSSPIDQLRKIFANGDTAGRFLIILIGILIIGLLAGIALLIRRILLDRSSREFRFSDSIRRIEQNDSSLTQEGSFRDTSSSVDHYLPDSRSHRRSSKPFFRRKG